MTSIVLQRLSKVAARTQLIDSAAHSIQQHHSTSDVHCTGEVDLFGDSLETQQPQHRACHAATKWLCVWSEVSGLYKNYKRHDEHCAHCSRESQITAAEQSDKENRLSTTVESESSRSAVAQHSGEAAVEM